MKQPKRMNNWCNKFLINIIFVKIQEASEYQQVNLESIEEQIRELTESNERSERDLKIAQDELCKDRQKLEDQKVALKNAKNKFELDMAEIKARKEKLI